MILGKDLKHKYGFAVNEDVLNSRYSIVEHA